MASIGRIEEFNAHSQNISSYLEWIEVFLHANGIIEDKNPVVLLSLIGGRTYEILCDILYPTKPQEKRMTNWCLR